MFVDSMRIKHYRSRIRDLELENESLKKRLSEIETNFDKYTALLNASSKINDLLGDLNVLKKEQEKILNNCRKSEEKYKQKMFEMIQVIKG